MTQEPIERPQPEPLARVPWVAVAVFVALAWGLAWLVMLPMWRLDPVAAATMPVGTQMLLQLLPSVMMFTPAVAMLVVVFVLRSPRRGGPGSSACGRSAPQSAWSGSSCSGTSARW